MSINFTELRELIGAMSQTDIGELTLKTDDFELSIRKETKAMLATPSSIASTLSVLPVAESNLSLSPAPIPETGGTPPAPAPTIDKKWVSVTSPMVGTFYRAPAPDESPFVDTGDRIRSGQTVCIIEAMKLMNEIEAEISGKIVEIVVSNGEPVEYGQTLMWVDPS